MRIKVLLFCLFGFCTSLSLAQIEFETPVLPSPTAAGLGEYGEIPISHHTGVPNISIPLYTLQEGKLQLPISMSYHSSGVRVDELASWVGLGWSLNAGGTITRTIMGTPDEGGSHGEGVPHQSYTREGWYQNFGMHPGLLDPSCWEGPYQQYASAPIRECREYYLDAANGFIDSQPDLFNFNVAGYSGKFLFDQSGKARILPFQDILIEPEYDDVNETFLSWTLTTPDGTKYFFGTDANAVEQGYSGTGNYVIGDNKRSTTSWYLTRIESMNGENWIELSYTREQYSFANRQGHTVMADCNTPPGTGAYQNLTQLLSVTNIDGCRLSQITTSSGQTIIDFLASSQTREDLTKYANFLQDNEEAKSLSEIVITTGGHVQTFHLDSDYFLSPNLSLGGNYSIHDRKRLRLNAIQEITRASSAAPNFEHRFSYDPTPMARRLSLGRDFWGYYNGADANTGLIPAGVINPCSSNQNPINSLADRVPDSSKMKAWILTDIQYPTGGTTTFDYEAHWDGAHVIGGLRVRQIQTSPEAGATNIMTKTFTYANGLLYGGYPLASSFQKQAYTGVPFYSSNNYIDQLTGTDVDYIVEATPPNPSKNTQGYHIGYGVVTLDLGSEGKSVFNYHQTLPTNQNYLGSFPAIPVQSSSLGGKLYREKHLDASDNLISSTDFVYQEDQKDTLELRIISSLGQTSNPYLMGLVPVFNDYQMIISRAILARKITLTDGVQAEETYTYASAHNFPVSTTIVGSDGSSHKTETRYFDHWLETNCTSNPDSCQEAYFNSVTSIRAQYEEDIQIMDDQGTSDPSDDIVVATWTTIPAIDAAAFDAAMTQAQADYLSCLQTEKTSLENCREDELDNFSPSDNSLNDLPEMIRRNLITPLEVIQKVDGTIIGGSKLIYEKVAYPGSSYPIHVVPTAYHRWINGQWELEVEVWQDAFDNLIEHKRAHGQPTAYLFGHNNRLPIAQITNASSEEIAYTSFEIAGDGSASENGRWELKEDIGGAIIQSTTPLSPYWIGSTQTGMICYRMFENGNSNPTGNHVATNILHSGRYRLSFWYKGEVSIVPGNGASIQTSPASEWTWYNINLDLSANTTLSLHVKAGTNDALIDELRLHPVDAQMSTMCYDDRRLIQTMTEFNGQSTYYQYDWLGRLKYVLDQDGNYLQGMSYHFRSSN
ncbi:MAG: hypothetical protein AAF587_28265 [Bacteroidota bacterium]